MSNFFNPNYHELSEIYFPTEEHIWKTVLFVRNHTRHIMIAGNYCEVNVFEFNTWMNLFAANKWYKYCNLGELYLSLNIKGGYHLQVIGSNRSHVFGRIESILVDIDIDLENAIVHIPEAKNYEGVFFIIFERKDKPINIISAFWVTDKMPERENHLAIVICTYKKEQYIKKTIAAYESLINSNQNLKKRMGLFVIDNGRTLGSDNVNERISIIPNKNVGGTGGFTRGLIEAQNQHYNRILFMDDDVAIPPGLFKKVVILSDYLKEEYKDAFINGPMLDYQVKDVLFENLAVRNNFWVDAYKYNLSVDSIDNILFINDIPDELFVSRRVHSAWWCHCFDISDVEKSGYPFPFFVWGDDMEWSWRRQGKHHISINGVFVWHEPFDWRVTKVRQNYYYERNGFVLNVIYSDDFKNTFQKHFQDTFNYLLRTYDYISIEIFFRALDDIMRGRVSFEEDPAQQLEKLVEIEKKVEYFEATNDDLEYVKSNSSGAAFKRKAVYALTCFGKYCPNFLFSNESIALEWRPSIRSFMLRKKVKVFNLMLKKYCIREFDRKKHFYFQREFNSRLKRILKMYDELKVEYLEAKSDFTSLAFWQNYLGLRG